MKSLFLVLALIVAVQSMPPDLRGEIQGAGLPCHQETGADVGLVNVVRNGDYSTNDWKMKLFNLCVLKKIKFVDAGNTFHREIAAQRLHYHAIDMAAVDKCVDRGNVVSPELAWTYVKCFNTERPNDLRF